MSVGANRFRRQSGPFPSWASNGSSNGRPGRWLVSVGGKERFLEAAKQQGTDSDRLSFTNTLKILRCRQVGLRRRLVQSRHPVPEAKQVDLRAETNESAEKLASLKQAILDTRLPFPPFDGYPCQYAGLRINWQLASRDLKDQADREALREVAGDGIVQPKKYELLDDNLRRLVHRYSVVHLAGLDEFGRRVSEQLWQAIQAERNLPDTPPTAILAETDPLAEEAAYHEQFMESRLRVYVGRQDVQNRLMLYAEGNAPHPCLVTGRSGSGKSAALARFARSYAEAHPNVLLISHFVGASAGSTSLRQMLRRFCLELQRRLGPEDEVPVDLNGLVSRFRQAIEAVPPDARVVLVIDAVNQLDETDNAHSMYWLSWKLPPQVKVVVSCIHDIQEGEESTEPVLKALASRPLERLEIQPLTGDERLEIVSQVPSLSAKKLDSKQIGLLLSNPATDNPLFLLVALEELRGFGSYEQVADRIAAFPHESVDPVGALFGQVIQRLREEFDPDVVRTVLALLACARRGMSERELLEMLEGIGVEQSTSDLFPVLRQLRPYLQHRGETLDFFHRGLYKAARECYLNEHSVRIYHQDLAGYFHAKLNPPGAEAWSGESPRALSELPHHQTQGQLWDQLEATLTALPFLEGKVTGGMPFDLAGDFVVAVGAIPVERPSWRTLQLLEEALRRDIHFIARHAQEYPQGLFQCLWNTCWWYDCEQASKHYVEPRAGWNERNAPWRRCDDARLCRLLERWREWKMQASPELPWVASHRPPPLRLGTAQKAVLRGHSGWVHAVAFSPTANRIATTSSEGVRVFDVASGAELVNFTYGVGVNCAAFSLTADQVVTGSTNRPSNVWDANTGEQLAVLVIRADAPSVEDANMIAKRRASGLERSADARCTAYSPDARRIVVGGNDGIVRLFKAATGELLWEVRGHPYWNKRRKLETHLLHVSTVAFSPRGDRIVSGARDGTLRVWDAESGANLGVMRGPESEVHSVSYSPDGRRIVSGNGYGDNTVRVWDAESGTELAALHGHEGSVVSVTFSPDGRRVASGSWDGTVRVWDAQSGAQLVFWQGHAGGVESVAFSPSGDQIAGGCHDGTVLVWDAAGEEDLTELRGHQTGRVESVARSPRGDRIVSKCGDTVRIWDATSGEELAVLPGLTSSALSPGGDRIAGGSEDGTLRLWDTYTGEELAVWRGHTFAVSGVVFSPDGHRIAGVEGGGEGNRRYEFETVRLWDAETGIELAQLPKHERSVAALAFSPNGDRIITASSDEFFADRRIRLWDVASGAKLASLEGHDRGYCSVAFSPNGQRIASGGSDMNDQTVRVWDAETGKELAVLRGHKSAVKEVVFSQDGNWIGSVDLGGAYPSRGDPGHATLRIWDIAKGECLEIIRGCGDLPAIVAATSSGFGWRAICRDGEFVVEPSGGGRPLARFPVALSNITTLPNGCAWAGSAGSHLYILTLESAPPVEAENVSSISEPLPTVDCRPLTLKRPSARELDIAGEITNSVDMKLILIPVGNFLMGSPDSDELADPSEKPQHRLKPNRRYARRNYASYHHPSGTSHGQPSP